MTKYHDVSDRAAESLLERHYAVIPLPRSILESANSIIDESRIFFRLSQQEKMHRSSLELLEGYRSLGTEIDAVTGLPDLSESYTSWFRNFSANLTWHDDCNLLCAMRKAMEDYADLADAIMLALGRRLTGQSHPPLGVRELSYLQLNHSTPAQHGRSTLMEVHEDGHILTILKPTRSGLCIAPGELTELPSDRYPGGRFKVASPLRRVEIGESEGLVIPSSPTFFLTGGAVLPLFHGVMNDGHSERQSLMFFVNPSLRKPIEPWQLNDINRNVDINRVVDFVSGQYGLKAISEMPQLN